ncbi:hypothetical protein MPSEU_000968900 [Mayamaea pseudoterrestris]|nr:hypothetical protein MPSEU_000968900 [Mayamaea pseudoterrestris]
MTRKKSKIKKNKIKKEAAAATTSTTTSPTTTIWLMIARWFWQNIVSFWKAIIGRSAQNDILKPKTENTSTTGKTSSSGSVTKPQSKCHLRLQERVRTTQLCCNRSFPEPGITELVASYYKDLMVTDACRRMSYVIHELSDLRRVNSKHVQSLLAEVVDYTNYYVDHPLVIRGFLVLMVMGDFTQPKIRSELGLLTLHTVVTSTRKHLNEQAGDMITHIARSFDECVQTDNFENCLSKWNCKFIEGLLEHDILNLLLDVLPDQDVALQGFGGDVEDLLRDFIKILVIISIYLATHPEHAQAESLERVVGAVQAVREIDQPQSSNSPNFRSSYYLTIIMNQDSDSSWLLLGSTALAAATATGLILLQTDFASRLLLSPGRLQRQRRSWYAARWTQALSRAVQNMRVNHVTQSTNATGSVATTTQEDADQAELMGTDFVQTQAELEALLQKILATTTVKNVENDSATFQIARIGRDTKENVHGSRDYYVWIQQKDATSATLTYHQMSVTMFATCLADAMDRRVTSNTNLFVADGACGLGSRVISSLLNALVSQTNAATNNARIKSDSSNKTSLFSNIVNLQTPLWLVQLAVLVERRALSQTTLDKLLHGLCRLHALLHVSVHHDDGTTSDNNARRRRTVARTMVWMLPSAVVPILLAPLQRTFPDDRHVVCYAGCHQTIQAALRLQNHQASGTTEQDNNDALLLRWTDSVAATTPLTASLEQSASLMFPRYLSAMQGLSRVHASLVETWMACADAYLALKDDGLLEETSKSDLIEASAYLPYVCKLEFLFYGRVEHGTNAYWSLRSLLQYMTGTKSTEIAATVMDAAAKVLDDFTSTYGKLPAISDLSPNEQGAIQEVVFAHKLILIANKVLLDTCLPAEHWQLKQATRRGCSCCVLEAEVEEQMNDRATPAFNVFGDDDDGNAGRALVASAKSSTGYVDGKSMFAFDPSRFR